MTAQKKEQLVKLAKLGLSDEKLSDEFGISKSYVVTLRLEGGVKYKRGGRPREADSGTS
jgi:hypothetical protein